MARRISGRGEAQKRNILSHAALLFESRGYAATRVADVANAAGVAKGLVFWYFGSKEELLQHLSVTVQQGLMDLIREAVRGLPDPLERLYAAMLVSVHYVDENFHLYGALNVASQGREDAPFRQRLMAHAEDTGAVLARWQARGVIRDNESPVRLAYVLSAIINELVRFNQLGLLGGGVSGAAALAARFAVYGLAAKAEQADAVVAAHARLASKAAAARRRLPGLVRPGDGVVPTGEPPDPAGGPRPAGG
jgi:AcrR family transcriptional regulator